jgi:hypothetical protein
MNTESHGRKAYSEDLRKRPTYHDGKPRKTWEQLHPIARFSWERPVRTQHEDRKHVSK